MATLTKGLDPQFYLAADAFFTTHAGLALTFDDLTLATLYSEISHATLTWKRISPKVCG